MIMAFNRLKFWQTEILVVLWLSYGGSYLLRKPLALFKDDIQNYLNLSSTDLGWVDMAFLLPYALVSLGLSSIGDRLGPRLTFGGGLLISALASILVTYCGSFVIVLLLLAISGAAQSLGWPAACSLLSKWYSDDSRNSVFGMFGTCTFVGGLAGTGIALWVQNVYGWQSVFIPAVIIVTILSALVLLTAYPPEYRGLNISGRVADQPKSEESDLPKGKPSFLSLWKISLVPEISIAMFCIKAVRYALMLWLPLYFLRSLGYSKVNAGLAATAFEIGGVCGSALIGIIVDQWVKGKPILVSAIGILGSVVALLLFILTASWGPIFHVITLAAAGALNCGPDILLAGSVAAEIGDREGGIALGVIGVVNGMGSLGTVIEGPLVSVTAAWFGWSSMMPLMIVLSCIGAAATYRANVLNSKLSTKSKSPELVETI